MDTHTPTHTETGSAAGTAPGGPDLRHHGDAEVRDDGSMLVDQIGRAHV